MNGVNDSTAVDCKSGPLAGCGLRFCSLKCLVVCKERGHAVVCQEVQRLLAMFKAKNFRPDDETHNAAADLSNAMMDGGRKQAQVGMLAADLFAAKDEKGQALRFSSGALRKQGAYRLALDSAGAALKLALKGTAEAADCYNNIGNVLLRQGKHEAAMEKYEVALQICTKVFGEDDASVATCYGNMGNVLQEHGKHEAAMEKYEAALQIMKKVFGEEHPDVASCYNCMGRVLQEQGKHAAAMEKYEATLRIREKLYKGEEHADVAMSYNNLGTVLQEQGKHDAAMEKYKAALQIRKKVFGEEHVAVAMCDNNMGGLLQEQGKHDAAMEKLEAALQIYKKVHNGEEHADVAMCYSNIGDVLQAQSKHEAAMEKYKTALQIYEKVLGEEHADVATCYNNIGCVLQAQGEHEAAMEKYEAALQIYNIVSGADSANYSSALLLLASYACVTKSSLDDSHLLAELRRIVDIDDKLLNSIEPSVFAFGLRDHVLLLRLRAQFGHRTGEAKAVEQWRANVQRLINVAHPVVRAIGLQVLAYMRADGRFASATACESERLLAALRASASPCALREATGAREQLLSSLVVDEASARQAQMRAVVAHSHSLSLLGLDGLELVDDDLVAQLMRARVLEHEVLQRCAGELSHVKARDTSSWTRNGVADVFVLLLNVLDQAYARLAVASGATGDKLFFPCKGSTDALIKAAGFAQLAAHIQQRIEAQQPFSFFKDSSPDFDTREWLHLTSQIANDNKHIKLSQHVHSATLKDKSRGTIEQRDVTLNVSASGPSPDLSNWTLYHWPALVEAAHDDAERRAVSRLARKFLTGLERGVDGNTAAVGGVAENKYLEPYQVGSRVIFFVPRTIAAMNDEALRRELVKDLARFDLVRKYSGMIEWLLAPERGDDFLISLCKRELEKAVGKETAAVVDAAFVGEVKLALDGRRQRGAAPDTMPERFLSRFVDAIQSFLRMRIEWQTPSEPLADASNEAQIDLVALMRRAIDNTCELVVEMVDARVALPGEKAIKSGADMFAPVDWLVLSDAKARDVVARGGVEVRASAWSVVDDLVKDLLADSDFAASATAYQRLHAIGRALENDDDVGAFAKLWERVIDRVMTSDSELARSLAPLFAVRLRDTLALRATTPGLCQMVDKINKVAGSFKIELPSLAGVKVDSDLVAQLRACVSSAHKLRVQSLQLRCGDGRDVLLRNETSVTLSVALGKCRAVLEHAFTRFARLHVWSDRVKKEKELRDAGQDPSSPLKAHEVFQAKFADGANAETWRANLLRQLCRADEPEKSLAELFPGVDASVWQALEAEQGYKLGGGAWVDELVSVVNESKHVCVRLVDAALLQAWWARGDIKSVDASFPLFVRDKWFYTWSFVRECGDYAEEMLTWLCERGVLSMFAQRGLKREESGNVKKQFDAAWPHGDVDPTKLSDIAKARARLHASSFRDALALEADLSSGRLTQKLLHLLNDEGIALDEKLARDESEHSKAKSEKRKACDGTVDADFGFDLFGDAEIDAKVDAAPVVPVTAAAAPPAETSSSETRVEQRSLNEMEITVLRALLDRQSRHVFALLRALPDFLVATQCGALRELTLDEIADASEEFPRLNVAAVARRVANSVRARQHEDQVVDVDASVCVGGIEFLERCVQGAARVVAAMARASAKSAQPSGSAAAPAAPVAPTVVVSRSNADDDDADDGGVGKQKLRRGRK